MLEEFRWIFYVFNYVKEGGGLLMHEYVWEHIAFPTEPIGGCWPNLEGMK